MEREKVMDRRILVITQYFYPENHRTNDVCFEWAKRGNKVSVVTAIPNYPQGKFYKGYGFFKKTRERYNGVQILRLPIIPRGNNALTLSLNYFSFVLSGYFWSFFTKTDADVVFVFAGSPIIQAFLGIWYAQKKRVPVLLYVQDLWPETVEALSGIKNKFVIKALGKIVDYIYAKCDIILVSSRGYIDPIKSRGVPADKIKYWPQYAEDFYKPLPRDTVEGVPEDDGIFKIIFTGNIGASQGLYILPKAAKMIESMKFDIPVKFIIVGDGRYKDELTRQVDELDVRDYFVFISRQPAERIPKFLAASDVAFLSLRDNPAFSYALPAKLQSYMACGKPILAVADGEVKKIVEEANAGLCSPAGDVEKFVQNIITLAKKNRDELNQIGFNARKYYLDNFDKEKLLNEMNEFFESVLNSRIPMKKVKVEGI